MGLPPLATCESAADWGSRNGHSPLLQVWGRFQTDTKGKPAGVSLLPFARQLFHVWTLLSAKGMFSGSDVARRLKETSIAFRRAFTSNFPGMHCLFDL